MRLSFHIQGDEVVGAVEAGALSFKRSVPYSAAHIRELTNELMVVLGRGGREHTLSAANIRRLEEVGGMLSHELVHPELASRLPEGGESIFLQLDESLVAVPWELLHDGEDFWCRRFDLGRAVQTPQAVAPKSAALPSSPLRMLVICCDSRGDLPHVMSEGEALIEHFDRANGVDATLLVDPTVEQVQRQLTRYDVVHFAGHANHDVVTPAQSGWHLADGKLTAGQIAAMAGARTMPFLVFANACNSTRTGEWAPVWDGARPSDLPVYGLANAFLVAGVRLYVGTQQEIVDGQSENLSIAFYEALGRGAGAGQAMRVARRAVVRDQGQEAMAWASYVLYGDPALTPIRPREFRATDHLGLSQRESRMDMPVKRPMIDGRSAPGPRAREKQRKRMIVLAALLSGLLTLAALSISLFLLLRRPGVTEAGDGANMPQFVQGEEGVADAPTVAVAASSAGAGSCIEKALKGDRRFAFAGSAQAAVQTLEMARSYAQSVEAELVIFVGKEGAQVADVLTGDKPLNMPALAEDVACRDLVQQMARTFLGQGEVIAIEGERVIVNLGWKSRVAPGMMLTIFRKGHAAGQLQVEKVEMDRAIARGSAFKGDQVRVPK